MDKPTTELERIKQGERYTWGIVVEIHEIGDIAIIESVERGKPDTPHEFHSYVNGQRTRTYNDTLDKAIIDALAHKYTELNSRAAVYVCRVLGIPTEG